MKKCQDTFDRMVATEITYPLSDDVFAMLSVSNYLVQFGRNELGKHGFYLCFATLTDSNTTGQHSQRVSIVKLSSAALCFAVCHSHVYLALLVL